MAGGARIGHMSDRAVTLLVRAQRNGQSVLGYGLSDHYRQIFELTRLDEAVSIHDTESEALAAASGGGPTPIPASKP